MLGIIVTLERHVNCFEAGDEPGEVKICVDWRRLMWRLDPLSRAIRLPAQPIRHECVCVHICGLVS